uniref:Smoothelin like 1 n=1 Tax=Panthera tigris altaica TaxID=74533 RepID=A0A8C9M7Y7_PANTA
MEHKQGEPSKDGTTVSPAAEAPVTQGDGASAEKEAKATAEKILKEGPPERALAEASTSAEFQGEANGWDEVKVEAKGEAELHKEGGGKEEITAAPQETADGKEETQLDPKEAKEGQETTPASEKQQADEKQAEPESREEARVSEEAKAEPKQATGEREAETGAEEADGKEGATAASQEESDKPEGPAEEQDQGVERESEEGAGVIPSSPEEWLESPKEEDSGLSPGGLGPDTTAASGETSPSASDAPQTPTEPPPSQEKKKEKAPERRVSAPARPRGPRAQNRKAIVDKFGGAASGPTALFRNTKAAGAAIGSVKNMLLEWCRAMTRNYEHVDIQNFSSSWSSGMAFCALIHKFFPDAFDYAALEPSQRRHNLTLAFSTLWLVYTYIQELYRSLVQKGLVKTKKK